MFIEIQFNTLLLQSKDFRKIGQMYSEKVFKDTKGLFIPQSPLSIYSISLMSRVLLISKGNLCKFPLLIRFWTVL